MKDGSVRIFIRQGFVFADAPEASRGAKVLSITPNIKLWLNGLDEKKEKRAVLVPDMAMAELDFLFENMKCAQLLIDPDASLHETLFALRRTALSHRDSILIKAPGSAPLGAEEWCRRLRRIERRTGQLKAVRQKILLIITQWERTGIIDFEPEDLVKTYQDIYGPEDTTPAVILKAFALTRSPVEQLYNLHKRKPMLIREIMGKAYLHRCEEAVTHETDGQTGRKSK